MSRVGKKIIEIPKDVKVSVTESEVAVEGPKGKLATAIPQGVSFKLEDGKLTAERQSDEYTAIHGTARALVANAITGVSKGFTQEMDVVGVGYKAELRGRAIRLRAGVFTPDRVCVARRCDGQDREVAADDHSVSNDDHAFGD